MLRRFLDTLCGEKVGQHLELTSQRVHQNCLVIVGVGEDVPIQGVKVILKGVLLVVGVDVNLHHEAYHGEGRGGEDKGHLRGPPGVW